MRRTPTEADRMTGQNVRALRKYVAGETLTETVERAGLGISPQSLSRIELGEKVLTLPVATKLAAHFDTTLDRVIAADPVPAILDRYQTGPAYTEAELAAINAPTWNTTVSQGVPTEQAWLGNPEPAHLFAVPSTPREELDRAFPIILPGTNPNLLMIDLTSPLTPEQYREQVWIPYLETRYSNDMKAS